ncbi:hypothetical protein [Sedimenticola selenatireducens]|nr:hypothetical protein [Sedimenticola selenatireducens]
MMQSNPASTMQAGAEAAGIGAPRLSMGQVALIARRLGTYLYTALLGYIMWNAWQVSGERYIVAEQGVGYWLGIATGVAMLLMLVYPWRKRRQFPVWLGGVKFWFRMHLGLGITVTCVVLLHSNFSLGSFNSQVALYCMMLVAASGLVGRYFYTQLHYGFSGKRKEIRDSVEKVLKHVDGLHALIPTPNSGDSWDLSEAEKLRKLAAKDEWKLREQLRLFEEQLKSQLCSEQYPQLKKAYSRKLRKVHKSIAAARALLLFERLFSLWHVIHVPFFIMLVASVIFHVIAVHMY